MPILFDHNSVTGVSQYFDYDPAKDTYYLTTTQDLSGMLDKIKQSRDNPDVWGKGDVNGMSSVLIYFPEIDSTAVYNPQLFSPRSTL